MGKIIYRYSRYYHHDSQEYETVEEAAKSAWYDWEYEEAYPISIEQDGVIIWGHIPVPNPGSEERLDDIDRLQSLAGIVDDDDDD